MGVLFISHSSRDNDHAIRVRDWLETQGWGRSQIFLDLDNFRSGDRWRNRLDQAGGECEAVIVCLSDNWIASPECLREFNHAETLGKRIFPIMVCPVTAAIPTFVSAIQFGDISSADKEAAGFEKLKGGLLGARIAPNYFPWPPANEPSRSVYRGLQPLDVQDAAIFFGRDAHITRGLDDLRRMRDGAAERMFVILGSSGAGKSSFLRAGLIARLKRDEENFLVLPIVRPGRAALTGTHGLVASLAEATAARFDPSNSPHVLAQCFAAVRALATERLQRHAEAAGEPRTPKPPTLILPIDQAEELFGSENAERAAFCQMLAGAVAQDGNTLIVATIRSDSYEPLQVEPHLSRVGQLLFNLPPIAPGSFKEIIEGPARLAKPPLVVEPALTQVLLADLNAADALPLLAFTLERLQSQSGGDNKLTLGDYRDELGGLSGAIQSAVDAVLGARPSKDKLALTRRLFVPALVQVDQDGVKRRVARRSDLPGDTQALADQFVTQRLLVSDDGKVEVAHEAILRQWPALEGWIAEERGALITLDGVRAAARDWRVSLGGKKSARGASWLLHRSERLKDAQQIAARGDFASVVNDDMRGYLAACGGAQRAEQAVRRFMFSGVVVAILAVLATGTLYYFYQQQRSDNTVLRRDYSEQEYTIRDYEALAALRYRVRAERRALLDILEGRGRSLTAHQRAVGWSAARSACVGPPEALLCFTGDPDAAREINEPSQAWEDLSAQAAVGLNDELLMLRRAGQLARQAQVNADIQRPPPTCDGPPAACQQ